jgi:hypothetical protein
LKGFAEKQRTKVKAGFFSRLRAGAGASETERHAKTPEAKLGFRRRNLPDPGAQ